MQYLQKPDNNDNNTNRMQKHSCKVAPEQVHVTLHYTRFMHVVACSAGLNGRYIVCTAILRPLRCHLYLPNYGRLPINVCMND